MDNQLVPGCKLLGLPDDVTTQRVNELVFPGSNSCNEKSRVLICGWHSFLVAMGRWFFWLDHMRNEGSSNPVNLLFVSKWQERGAAYSGLHATVLWWLQTLQRVWSICVLHPPKNHLVWLLRSSFQSVIVMDVVGIEIEIVREGVQQRWVRCSICGTTVPRGYCSRDGGG